MANPVIVACTKDAWTKVATGVKTGFIKILKNTPDYYETYRVTTDPAPTGESEASPFYGPVIQIENSVDIDVYVYCKREAGSVRVDL